MGQGSTVMTTKEIIEELTRRDKITTRRYAEEVRRAMERARQDIRRDMEWATVVTKTPSSLCKQITNKEKE